MLASPLYPTTSFSPHKPSDESPQYRPAKDMEAFNSLLPPAIEFVEGSSSGTLILGEGKYEPINASPKAKVEVRSQFPPMLILRCQGHVSHRGAFLILYSLCLHHPRKHAEIVFPALRPTYLLYTRARLIRRGHCKPVWAVDSTTSAIHVS